MYLYETHHLPTDKENQKIIWNFTNLMSFFYNFLLKNEMYKEQERKTFIRSEAITMSCMIVIPENHSTRDETDYVIS